MLDPIGTITQPSMPKPTSDINVEGGQFTFSYSAAIAEAERSAGQALKIHGGTQNGASGDVAATANQASNRRDNQKTAELAHATDGAMELESSGGQARQVSQTAPSPDSKSQSPMLFQQQVQTNLAPSLVAATTASASATAGATKVTQAPMTGALSEAKAGTSGAFAKRAASMPTPTSPTTESFAKLLASRVDGKSSFELRLDPPELGKVEGRLDISDNGGSKLVLKFDNREAFDLFRQDSEALKAALANLGQEIGDAEIAFEFKAHTEEEAVAPGPSTPLAGMPFTEETFQFKALYSSGAIDINV